MANRSAIARAAALIAAAGLCSVAALDAQSKSKSEPKPKNETITLSGCVVRSETAPGQYTLADKEADVTYRLTGINVRDYVGKPVVVVGTGVKKLAIVGGLTPNPNVAAQAGAMDPTRAIVAGQTSAASPGTVGLPEFKVKSVRPTTGSCSE
jgi:hypothetical protein